MSNKTPKYNKTPKVKKFYLTDNDGNEVEAKFKTKYTGQVIDDIEAIKLSVPVNPALEQMKETEGLDNVAKDLQTLDIKDPENLKTLGTALGVFKGLIIDEKAQAVYVKAVRKANYEIFDYMCESENVSADKQDMELVKTYINMFHKRCQ